MYHRVVFTLCCIKSERKFLTLFEQYELFKVNSLKSSLIILSQSSVNQLFSFYLFIFSNYFNFVSYNIIFIKEMTYTLKTQCTHLNLRLLISLGYNKELFTSRISERYTNALIVNGSLVRYNLKCLV